MPELIKLFIKQAVTVGIHALLAMQREMMPSSLALLYQTTIFFWWQDLCMYNEKENVVGQHKT